MNPYYLRGDFDGDGKPDYGVWVKNKATSRGSFLVYLSSRRAFLEAPYTEDQEAERWEVVSKYHLLHGKWGFTKAPHPDGEAIFVHYGNGGVIFFVQRGRLRFEVPYD